MSTLLENRVYNKYVTNGNSEFEMSFSIRKTHQQRAAGNHSAVRGLSKQYIEEERKHDEGVSVKDYSVVVKTCLSLR